jgi:hypothetical protein
MASIFFSYSHEDELYRDQLEKHLSMLKRQGLIDGWHDRRILAGTDFAQEIDAKLEQANVVLLLVSASFLASDYCYGVEMKRAVERHEAGEARVIPVIVRPCDWHSAPFGQLLAAPRDGKAITTWSNVDEAYADVARQVREVVEGLPGSGRRPPPSSARSGADSSPARSTQTPRSSNLRLRQEFTEADKDKHLHDAFEFLADFFEASLTELQLRHSDVECRYRRVDANTFTAAIYRSGKKMAECSVSLGGGFRQGGITYSSDASSRGGSFNEMLSVDNDDQVLFFKPLGMPSHTSAEKKLSIEQAAEYYWDLLVSRLQ